MCVDLDVWIKMRRSARLRMRMKTGRKGRGERTCEALAVDRLAARAVEAREVAALEHELVHTQHTHISQKTSTT